MEDFETSAGVWACRHESHISFILWGLLLQENNLTWGGEQTGVFKPELMIRWAAGVSEQAALSHQGGHAQPLQSASENTKVQNP